MTDQLGNSGRKNGRPAKGDPPRVPYEELDRILVFGEVVTCEDGESTTVQYPSYRNLARRYDVCNSVIARYSKKHNREYQKAAVRPFQNKELRGRAARHPASFLRALPPFSSFCRARASERGQWSTRH